MYCHLMVTIRCKIDAYAWQLDFVLLFRVGDMDVLAWTNETRVYGLVRLQGRALCSDGVAVCTVPLSTEAIAHIKDITG